MLQGSHIIRKVKHCYTYYQKLKSEKTSVMRRIWDADESFSYPSWIYCYCTKDDPLYTALKKGDSCNGFRGPCTGVTGFKGCSCSLGQGLIHLALSLCSLAKPNKEDHRKSFYLGQLVFWIVVYHMSTHNMDLNCLQSLTTPQTFHWC